MAPPIRFFRGTDDQRIAYTAFGRGPHLVLPAWWTSHVERDWDDPGRRALFERLAEHATVVCYDRPGVGLSVLAESTALPELSLEEEVANLERLVAALDVDRVAMLGGSSGAPPAIAFAARHPERTTHLILVGGYASGVKLAPLEVRAAVGAIVRAHWGLGSKTLTELFAPDASPEEREHLAAMQRHATSAEHAARLLSLVYTMDVEALLPEVRVPTLVLHRKGDRAVPIENGRAVAAAIADASFVPLEGTAHFPWLGDSAAIADAVASFLRGAADASTPSIAGENAMRRRGDVWAIAFRGAQAHVKHTRGLGDIAALLAAGGREIAAVELQGRVTSAAKDVVLDEAGRKSVRRRIEELDARTAAAEAAGRVAVAEGAEREKAALVSWLRAATGVGGRRRALGDDGERARKAVTARIRDAIDKLRSPLPELARHLDASIRTGVFCAYAPETPIAWRT